MSSYKSYIHVEKLDSPDCEGLLDNDKVYITAKVDGTNAVVFWNSEKACVSAGSRTRELNVLKDNAGFCQWVQESNCDEVVALREVVTDHPNWLIYGEWLGNNKFIGSIKTYNLSSLGHLYIFDVYDIETQRYLADEEWRGQLSVYGLIPYFIPILAVLNHPTYEEVAEVAEANSFLLPEGQKGEGVVCKVPNFVNKFGHFAYGKIVLAEYKQQRYAPKEKHPRERENQEQFIVDDFVTVSELNKAKEKVCVMCGRDEFNTRDTQMIGMFLTEVWVGSILDEIKTILKKYKNPVIDFRILNRYCVEKARKYLNL